MLILVCGLPGVGKSTLAKALSKEIGATYLSSDIIRRKMLAERTYSEHEKYKVYQNMVAETQRLLSRGETVVCDATFYKKNTRNQMRSAAEAAHSKVLLVKCVLDPKSVEERMRIRKLGGDNPSEADFSVYLRIKELYEEIEGEYVQVDTGTRLEEQIEAIKPHLDLGSGWEVEELLESSLYPEAPGSVELKETHISWVFLAGDYVYKIKKPVNFSFLNFSTKERRREFCEEEVRLNKRLCPGIYLDTVPLVRNGGALGFGGEGQILDYAVKMRRMRGGDTMDKALSSGKITAEDVAEIAASLVEFHEAVPIIQDPQYNSPDMVAEQIADLASVKETVDAACGMGEKVDLIVAASLKFIEENRTLLRNRQADGMVKECHGDLHSGNIYIGEEKHIFDCIEFNEDFRFIDVASEIAFMAMDLDARGREDLGDVFVKRYLEGANDPDLEKMLGLYKCYRANVRAKVAALGYMQNPTEVGKKNIEKYLLLAEKYAKAL